VALATVLDALGAAHQLGPAPDEGTDGEPLAAWRHVLPTGFAPAATGGPSAVLIALFEEAGEARVVLTRRSAELRTHRGQVSFPGGRMDPHEDAARTALREAHEEIGLEPDDVRVVGWLHPLFTLTSSSLVLPIVGVLGHRPTVVPNPAEVARVFDVELAQLVADGAYQEGTWDPYEPWADGSVEPRQIWFFGVDGERVWGATARLLHELVLLALGIPPDAPEARRTVIELP
jgi:8-oxo-dGTP pyrophosphatase MutT (NUDIX family)